jgi:hypothetical protein
MRMVICLQILTTFSIGGKTSIAMLENYKSPGIDEILATLVQT